jgi:hypothetical protein
MSIPSASPPEPSVTELLAQALDRAEAIARRAEEAPHATTKDPDPHSDTSTSIARRQARILREALAAIKDQSAAPVHTDAVNDETESGLRPDPRTALTAAELMACLRSFRAWKGQPSLRAIADRAGRVTSHVAISNTLNSDTMPSLSKLKAIVLGCGGSEHDQQRFSTAWQRIVVEATKDKPSSQRVSGHQNSRATDSGPKRAGSAPYATRESSWAARVQQPMSPREDTDSLDKQLQAARQSLSRRS